MNSMVIKAVGVPQMVLFLAGMWCTAGVSDPHEWKVLFGFLRDPRPSSLASSWEVIDGALVKVPEEFIQDTFLGNWSLSYGDESKSCLAMSIDQDKLVIRSMRNGNVEEGSYHYSIVYRRDFDRFSIVFSGKENPDYVTDTRVDALILGRTRYQDLSYVRALYEQGVDRDAFAIYELDPGVNGRGATDQPVQK